MWIIHDDDVWEADQLSDADPPSEDFELKKSISGKRADWNFDDSVDVVIRVIDDNNKDVSYLLRAPNQMLGMTY